MTAYKYCGNYVPSSILYLAGKILQLDRKIWMQQNIKKSCIAEDKAEIWGV